MRAAPHNRIAIIKDDDGNILSNSSDCLRRWKDYFKNLLNRPPHHIDPDLLATAPPTDTPRCNTNRVTRDEVCNALKRLKKGRAPGPDGIPAELLQNGGDSVINHLTDLINRIWSTEEIPDEWRRGIILPFWKKKGDRLICSNYRGITLLSVAEKLFASILIARAQPALNHTRRPQQAGFRQFRSTTEQIFAVRNLVQKANEFKRNAQVYIGFIDLKAAFDSVHRPSLWKCLLTSGLPEKLTSLFSNLYNRSESCVKIAKDNSDWFMHDSGVRQGCAAAPELFNCAVDRWMSCVAERIPGIALGTYRLTDLEYADDTTIFASTLNDLTNSLKICQEEALKIGLRINWSKTRILSVGNVHNPSSVIINGEEVKLESNFHYLGSIVSKQGGCEDDIKHRIGKAAGVLNSLHKHLWSQRAISRQTKLRIYQAAVLPVLCYGAETWTWTSSLANKLNAFDTRALRRIENIRWFDFVSNTELRRRTNTVPLIRVLTKRRLSWFGHLLRQPDLTPAKQMLRFNPLTAGWRRFPGRPPLRWEDEVRKDLQRLGIEPADIPSLATDRANWRLLVSRVLSTPSRHETQ